jgi:hypothetical protein
MCNKVLASDVAGGLNVEADKDDISGSELAGFVDKDDDNFSTTAIKKCKEEGSTGHFGTGPSNDMHLLLQMALGFHASKQTHDV